MRKYPISKGVRSRIYLYWIFYYILLYCATNLNKQNMEPMWKSKQYMKTAATIISECGGMTIARVLNLFYYPIPSLKHCEKRIKNLTVFL